MKIKKLKTRQLLIWIANICIVTLTIIAELSAKKRSKTESWYQEVWCRGMGGKIEVITNDSTRIDCLTDKYAIEMDFAKKWAEALGQSLYYAQKSLKKPGIVLILKSNKDREYLKRLNNLLNYYKLSVKVWELGPWR